MSNYFNNLLSRSFKETEVIRPRLPSIFEPITTPDIPVSGQQHIGQQYIGLNRAEKQTKSLKQTKGFIDKEFYSREFLNGPEKEPENSTGLSGPFELSEKQKKLKYSDLTDFQSDTQDPPFGSKPAQKETDPAGAKQIKSIIQEKSRLDFPESYVSQLDQAFSEKFVPYFKLSRNCRENLQEKQFLNIDNIEAIPQSAHSQGFNEYTAEHKYKNKSYAGQPGKFNSKSVQHVFQHGSAEEVKKSNFVLGENFLSRELNPNPEKSNFISFSSRIVPKLSENIAAAKIKQLENTASQTFPDSRTGVSANTNTEVEKTVIKVNIGRIEVKTVTQVSQPRRENKPQAPKLSLDSYLNSRNRGKA